MFRLIKAVASFPKVIYLLAFDRGVVCRALEEEQGSSGDKYLERSSRRPLTCRCLTVRACKGYCLSSWTSSGRHGPYAVGRNRMG